MDDQKKAVDIRILQAVLIDAYNFIEGMEFNDPRGPSITKFSLKVMFLLLERFLQYNDEESLVTYITFVLGLLEEMEDGPPPKAMKIEETPEDIERFMGLIDGVKLDFGDTSA